eukprot:scaffold237_cov421-Prasinococcus_capsulatus_cf.AAC.2
MPRPLRLVLGVDILELGPLYYLFMAMLAVFCTNSINILAGINGLEAGQTYVIGCAVLVHNLTQLQSLQDPVRLCPICCAGRTRDLFGVPQASLLTFCSCWSPQIDNERRDAHLFSVFVMIPLLGSCLGLLKHNWFPSRVFVGDTFTYFAGMTFAVAGILGHFSETLLLFFLPQVINFVYSIPQLFKYILASHCDRLACEGILRLAALFPGFPCPRHRLPKCDPKTQLLYPSDCENGWFKNSRGSPHMNCNLVNLALRLGGPCTEPELLHRLLAFQVACCMLGFAVRYALTGVYKDV